MKLKNPSTLYFFTIFSIFTLVCSSNITKTSTAFNPAALASSFFKPKPKKAVKRSAPSRKTTRSTAAVQNIISAAFDIAKIPAVLDNVLYKKTHPVQFRNIIQLPAFLSSTTKTHKDGWQFDLFLNSSFAKDYTDAEKINPRKLSAYLNLEDDTILGAFDNAKNVIQDITKFDDFSIPDLFNVFSPMKLQENRAGITGRYHKQWGNIEIDVKLPFLWVERNFNFTAEEKEKLYTNELLARFEVIDEWEFAKEYMISDQLGFGTLEASFSTDLIKNDSGGLKAGLILYFPTEIALKKGLLGTHRDLVDEQPALDFCSLIIPDGLQAKGAPGWEDKLSDYFVNAFTRFTSNLLYMPLGFDHHPGIAFHISPTWHINHRWTWKSNYSIEVLIPVYQDRLIVDTLSGETETSDIYANAATSADKIKFIEEVITERLYPRLSHSLIMPGAIFSSTSCFHYTKGDKVFSFGNSSWAQLREQILSHSLSDKVDWNIAAAEKPYASQVKLFGKIEKTIKRDSRDLTIGFYIDYTIFNQSIGNDFLINFEIKGRF